MPNKSTCHKCGRKHDRHGHVSKLCPDCSCLPDWEQKAARERERLLKKISKLKKKIRKLKREGKNGN